MGTDDATTLRSQRWRWPRIDRKVLSVLAVCTWVAVLRLCISWNVTAASAASSERRSSKRQSSSAALASPPSVARPAQSLSLPAQIPPPPPPAPLPSPKASAEEDKCFTRTHTEYDGQVVLWGPHTIVQTAGECCERCRSHRSEAEKLGNKGCTVWVWCPDAAGCGTQKQGECWGKLGLNDADGGSSVRVPQVRAKGSGVAWMSGAVFTPSTPRAGAKC